VVAQWSDGWDSHAATLWRMLVVTNGQCLSLMLFHRYEVFEDDAVKRLVYRALLRDRTAELLTPKYHI